jgi:hypothetical protein
MIEQDIVVSNQIHTRYATPKRQRVRVRARESERVVQEEACEIEAMGSAVQTSTMHTKGLCVNQTGRRYQLLLQQPKQDKYQVTMLVG